MKCISYRSNQRAKICVYWLTNEKFAIFFKESFELAIRKQFGYMLVEIDQNTFAILSHGSKIGRPGPSKFYLLSAQSVFTDLTDERERERSMYASAVARYIRLKKQLTETASSNFIKFLFECLLIIFNGNVPVNETKKKTMKNRLKSYYLIEQVLNKRCDF